MLEVEVVLERVADGAVALERLAGGEHGGVGGLRLGHRDVDRRVRARRSATDQAARYTRGRANSSAMRASARWCFTAWKLPIGHAELAPLLDVVDGQVEHAPGQADELRRGAQRAPVEGERGTLAGAPTTGASRRADAGRDRR